MKKYLFIAVAALLVASCSKDDAFDSSRSRVQDIYDAAFYQYVGGEIASNQDWGFGSQASSRAMITRSITVNGDVYSTFPSKDDVKAYFPTAIPADAKTDAELEAEWKGKNAVDANGNEIIASWGGTIQMWDLYAIYLNMVGTVINNIKVTTPGEYSVGHNWANPADRVYNVYIAVGEGNSLTLKRNGAEHVNFYIMSGNVTIDSNFGECGGIISVASGAIVNDQRTHIAHNDGIKVFNKGTYNATNTTPYWNGEENTSVFDIGNFCTFYNEGKFTCSGGLSYSPGDANDSYFMNLGDDAELTASSMTLNSTGNFFNSGKVTIEGETKCTQARLYWVNAGHYTTGSLTFSAKNCTFFNYCQLIVRGNAHMYDGEFNLMQNGYMEAGTAEMDNFEVNIASNTGLHIKGNVKVEAQGDGTFQGFHSAGTNNYLLIDGKVTVASHKKTFSIESGITYSIKEIEIVKGGNVVTEAYLQSIGDGDYPVLDLQGNECPYGKLTVDPGNYESCGATWSRDGDIPQTFDVRIIAEDLSATDNTDFDFNDVVFDVTFDEEDDTKATVTLLAAGGTLPLTVDGHEVHEKFGKPVKCMINTNANKILNEDLKKQGYTYANGLDPVSFEVTGINKNNRGKDIVIKVQKKNEQGDDEWYIIDAVEGKPAAKIAVDPKFQWCDEKQSLKGKYKNFTEWVKDPSHPWY